MKRILTLLALTASLSLAFTGCEVPESENNPAPGTEEIDYNTLKDGLTTVPEALNADQAVTFYYKAKSSDALYNSPTDLYFYTGIWYASDDWRHVPSDWGVNTDKCKMEKVADNVWKLEMAPSIREWYNSGETGIWYLGIVIRNEAGDKQTSPDFIIDVTDDLYEFDPFEPDPVVKETMPADLKHGINYLSDTSVALVLYDVDKNGESHDYCYLTGEFSGWERQSEYAMKRDETAGCWWIVLDGLEAGKEYMFQYWLAKGNQKTVTHDPYTEIAYDEWNDKWIPSSTYPDLPAFPEKASAIVSAFQTARPEYTWEVPDYTIEDKDDLIIYELLLREFTENGSYEGNLKLAMEKLDYLKNLGVNAIELMPVQEFDGNNSWGYSPNSFFALDKAYGTREDYKKFIDECHKRGMAVIFDVVYNHATGSCPLAKLYWNGSNTAENNPWFNVTAKHDFNVFHDINHESEYVRAFFKRNLTYLLEEYNIDGFRFDLTKGFTQKNTLGNTGAWGQKDDSRITILKDYVDAIRDYDEDAVVIFEHLSDLPEEKILGEYGIKLWRNMQSTYGQTAMGWNDSGAGRTTDFRGLYTGTASMPFGSLVGYMESHDEERCAYEVTQWGNGDTKTNLESRMKRLALNAAFFFTVPGPKMIWQFGELGYDISINDPGRTDKKPAHWEYFDEPARRGLYDAYSELIAFRRENPRFFDNDATFTWNVTPAYWQNRHILCTDGEGKSFAVIGNFDFTPAEVTVTLPASGNWHEWGKEDIITTTDEVTLNLESAEYKILVNY
ncbi:MAG: alpha-amylase [Bacteroidales bacterium]|nr:alpha-amylase [Bacteroidales bacterium]